MLQPAGIDLFPIFIVVVPCNIVYIYSFDEGKSAVLPPTFWDILLLLLYLNKNQSTPINRPSDCCTGIIIGILVHQ